MYSYLVMVIYIRRQWRQSTWFPADVDGVAVGFGFSGKEVYICIRITPKPPRVSL